MTVIDLNPLEIVIVQSKRRVDIKIYNESGVLVDGSQVDLQVLGLDGTSILVDSFTTPPPGGTRIVKPAGTTGTYYFTWGDPSAAVNTPDQAETDTVGVVCFLWSVVGPAGTEEIQRIQTVSVISVLTAERIRRLRGQIDKTSKTVNEDPANFCPLGYTDGNLMEYLDGGLSLINEYQPYPMWTQLDYYPTVHDQLLMDAAMVVGLNAQSIFAIDTDISQWNNQGNSWVLEHYPKLAAVSAALTARMDVRVPKMKLHYVASGSLKVETGPAFRLTTLVNMAPSGATFRNMFAR